MLVNPENGYRVFAVRNEFEFEGRVRGTGRLCGPSGSRKTSGFKNDRGY